jgi:tetratricopeptide (TPR) repeat protein
MRRGWHRDAFVLLPALLFLALHARTLDYELVWTDVPEIAHGSILRPPGQILHAFAEPLHAVDDFATRPFSQPYYRPLQVITASALSASFGREARVLRLVTLGLGALTAVLFTALACQLLRSRWGGMLAGAIFAVHPVGLEIYVWVGGLAAALAGTFAIGSLLCATRAFGAPAQRSRIAWAALSCAALCFGLLSKENAAVVPGLSLAVLLGVRARDRHSADVGVAPLGPALTLVSIQAALVAAYLLVLRPAVLGSSLTGSQPIGGRLATQWASSLAAWPKLIAWIWLPLSSTSSDAIRVVHSLLDPASLLGLGLALGSAGIWVFLLLRGHGVAAIGLAWAWIAFLPTSGLAPLLHARAERNLFLSVFGIALLWAWAGQGLGSRSSPGLGRRRAAATCAALLACGLVAGLAERSWHRQPAWRSTRALFERDLAADPRHREGRLNLIVDYAEAGDFAAAKPHVDVLVGQRKPVGWTSYALEANLLETACRVNAALGRDADTQRAVAGDPLPQSASAVWLMPGFYACYAPALLRLGRPAEALPLFEALQRGAPGNAGARFALGAAQSCAALGRAEEARAWLTRIPPALARSGELAREISQLRGALERD